MNRRTLLAGAGGISAFGLVSYFVYSFSLSTPVLITATNDAETAKGLIVTVTGLETNRKSIDTPVAVPVGATTQIGRVPNADAQAAVKLVELTEEEEEPNEDAVIEEESTLLGTDTKQLSIAVTDDGLELDLSYRE